MAGTVTGRAFSSEFVLFERVKCLSFGEIYVYKEEVIGATGALTCMIR